MASSGRAGKSSRRRIQDHPAVRPRGVPLTDPSLPGGPRTKSSLSTGQRPDNMAAHSSSSSRPSQPSPGATTGLRALAYCRSRARQLSRSCRYRSARSRWMAAAPVDSATSSRPASPRRQPSGPCAGRAVPEPGRDPDEEIKREQGRDGLQRPVHLPEVGVGEGDGAEHHRRSAHARTRCSSTMAGAASVRARGPRRPRCWSGRTWLLSLTRRAQTSSGVARRWPPRTGSGRCRLRGDRRTAARST